MERVETVFLGQRIDKTNIVRHLLINDDNTNYLLEAQSCFTREQKKLAKLSYKNSNPQLFTN